MIQVRKVIVIYWIFTSPSIDLDLKCQVIMTGFADQATSSLNSSCDYKSLHISPSPDNLSAVCFPNNPLPSTWFLAKNTTRKLRFTPKLVIFFEVQKTPLQAFYQGVLTVFCCPSNSRWPHLSPWAHGWCYEAFANLPCHCGKEEPSCKCPTKTHKIMELYITQKFQVPVLP